MDVNSPLSAIRGLDSLTNGAAGVAGAGASGVGGAAAAAGAGFAEAMKEAAQSTVAQLRGAEQLSVSALKGDADIRDVADAVMSAEQSLQAAITIRDKIVNAFLEVSRMQI